MSPNLYEDEFPKKNGTSTSDVFFFLSFDYNHLYQTLKDVISILKLFHLLLNITNSSHKMFLAAPWIPWGLLSYDCNMILDNCMDTHIFAKCTLSKSNLCLDTSLRHNVALTLH